MRKKRCYLCSPKQLYLYPTVDPIFVRNSTIFNHLFFFFFRTAQRGLAKIRVHRGKIGSDFEKFHLTHTHFRNF